MIDRWVEASPDVLTSCTRVVNSELQTQRRRGFQQVVKSPYVTAATDRQSCTAAPHQLLVDLGGEGLKEPGSLNPRGTVVGLRCWFPPTGASVEQAEVFTFRPVSMVMARPLGTRPAVLCFFTSLTDSTGTATWREEEGTR